MNRHLSGVAGVVTALAVAGMAGCAEDPLSGLDGNAAAIVTSIAHFQFSEGGSGSFIASVVDGRSVPLEAAITFNACDSDVGVRVDTSYHPVPATSARALVTAVSAGASCVIVSGSGVTDTVTATVLPVAFGGALSSTTPAGGSLMTIRSTAVLKFDTVGAVTVTFGGGIAAPIALRSRDSLRVVVPFSDAGPLTIGGIDVTYVPGLRVSLPTTASVTQTGDFYGLADTSFATAPVLTLPAATGQSTAIISNVGPANNTQCTEIVEGFGSSGPCMIYQFTLASPTSLTFSTNWAPGAALAPDIDIYACSGPSATIPPCFEDGGPGATGSKPQAFTFTFPAGTHFFVIEVYDATGGTRNITTTITRN